jgi:hypothetical protein
MSLTPLRRDRLVTGPGPDNGGSKPPVRNGLPHTPEKSGMDGASCAPLVFTPAASASAGAAANNANKRKARCLCMPTSCASSLGWCRRRTCLRRGTSPASLLGTSCLPAVHIPVVCDWQNLARPPEGCCLGALPGELRGALDDALGIFRQQVMVALKRRRRGLYAFGIVGVVAIAFGASAPGSTVAAAPGQTKLGSSHRLLQQCKRQYLHRANSDPINLGQQDGRYRRVTNYPNL